MKIEYDSTKSFQGILYSFYTKGEKVYQENLNFTATSEYSDNRVLSAKYAFDFNFTDSFYWLGDDQKNELTNLTFCLTKYYAKIYGFELAPNNESLRLPKKYAFSSSQNGNTFLQYQIFPEPISAGSSKYIPYFSPISKCFRLTCLENTRGGYAFDVDQIEIYGEFHTNIHEFSNAHPHKMSVVPKACAIFLFFTTS